MLQVTDLETCYGRSQVLFGVSLSVGQGEVVSLLGRNGMGKSTLVHSILGLTPPSGGTITFQGRELTDKPVFYAARAGIGLVPEGRQVFPTLTVRENLVATARSSSRGGSAWTLERIYELFPVLLKRQNAYGRTLSGGEQQMVAIGRALMTNPGLLILDEATEGLAPLIRDAIWNCIDQLKAEGQSILVIDRNLDALLRLADRHYILEKGKIVWTGNSHSLRSEPETCSRYLGV